MIFDDYGCAWLAQERWERYTAILFWGGRLCDLQQYQRWLESIGMRRLGPLDTAMSAALGRVAGKLDQKAAAARV